MVSRLFRNHKQISPEQDVRQVLPLWNGALTNQQKFVYKVLHLEAYKLQQQMLDLRISKQNCFNVSRCYYCVIS
ncbi:hypothetical protein T4E_9563 [Trichinella pseudospiralis]|uniref:Uncharacterized protein n=1 Tax=Trichinella pseudospiralis TaxID=6337 RepID=A0A0V0YCB8_TRIPS|nr:hypothetical protein T4E_9563 [Trichinella pseudospiralis]